MTNDTPVRPIDDFLDDSEMMLEAMRSAVADAYRRHKLLGESIVVSRDGKPVTLTAAEIPDYRGGLTEDERRKFAMGRLLTTLWSLEQRASASDVGNLGEMSVPTSMPEQRKPAARRVA